MSLAVDTVIIPITFEPNHTNELNLDRAIKVRADHWVTLSEASVAALRLGSLAVADGGTLHLVHATPDLTPAAALHGPGGMLIPANVAELHTAAKRQAETVLAEVAKRFCNGRDPVFHTSPGRPIDVVLECVRSTGADLVVMAASGRNRVERFVIGSTVDKLVRRALCPVMVVPR